MHHGMVFFLDSVRTYNLGIVHYHKMPTQRLPTYLKKRAFKNTGVDWSKAQKTRVSKLKILARVTREF